MDIFGLGTQELVVIGLLAAIVLGPERLVTLARKAGRLVRDLKSYFSSFSDELKAEIDVLEDLKQVERDLRN